VDNLRVPAALLDRDAELAALAGLLSAAAGGHGGVAVIAGPLGIGKTSLLRAAEALARDSGMTVLVARGAPLERDFPYGVARRLFEPLGLDGPTPADADLLAGAAGLAMPAFGTADESTARGDRAFATIHGLYWLTANLAARRPVVLAVDDCHWADEPSLRFLSYLGARLDGLPALVLVAVRTGEPAAAPEVLGELLASPGATTIHPSTLDVEATGALVGEVLGAPPTERFRQACHAATAGNPLLLRALLTGFRAQPAAPDDAAADRVAEFGASSIAEVLARQLAHLPPGASAVARAVAVLGAGAPLRHVAALAGLSVADAAQAADALRTATVLAPGAELDFAHPVCRVAVEEAMSTGERALAHEHAARVLAADGAPAERLAVHLLHAVPCGDGWAARTLATAGRLAAERGAPETAAVYLRRALDEPAPPQSRASLRLELGLSLVAARRDPTGLELLREAVAGIDPAERGAAALRVARTLGVAGYFDQAAALVEALPSEPDAAGRLLEAEVVANSWLVTARVPAARARLAAVAADRLPDDPGGRLLLVNLAHRSLADGEPAGVASELLDRALVGGEILALDSLVLTFLAMDLVGVDRLDDAERICTQVIAEGQRRGSPSIVASFTFPRAFARLRRGALADAEADARWSFDQKLAMGPSNAPAWPLAFLVDTLVARGDFAAADRALADVWPTDPPPEHMGWALAIEARGRLRLAQRRLREAADDLFDAGGRWERLGWVNIGFTRWRGAAAAAIADQVKARDLVREQLALAERTELPRTIGVALRDLAGLEPAPRRIDLLWEAVALLDRGIAAVDLAGALVDLGGALRRAGYRTDAREPLRRGLDLAHRSGAEPLAAQARIELLAAGGRPRRPVVTGVGALTVAERRVAQLAAEGLTNREIAQRLFVTQRTVETHLNHTFQKLGVRRREDLADPLGAAASSA
jgi:DNA-binding CsgD family transcriptional regulator